MRRLCKLSFAFGPQITDPPNSYFTDSLTNIIYAYDYDRDTGFLTNRRVFVDALQLGMSEGSFCDGLCIDDEGCVWSAR